MLNHQTIEKLRQMKLTGFASEFQRQVTDTTYDALSFEDRLGLLIDSEYDRRHNNKINRLLKQANLAINNASIEDIAYHTDRQLDPSLISKLATCDYIRRRHNVILLGATGSGKSFLACAFGNKACRNEFKVMYMRLPDLLVEIELARVQDTYKKLMENIAKPDLLILDEWLLYSLNQADARNLLEIIEIRKRKGSIIFCSQFEISEWHLKFDQATLADAILDRIIHNSHKIVIQGNDSMRKRNGIS
jgi:DNA replication protein DnaC